MPECPAGYYCQTNTTGTTQTVCPAGFYCPQGSMFPTRCRAGTYCPIQSQSETLCPLGTYCPLQSGSPHDCQAGTYCTDGINQIPCQPGLRSGSRASACSADVPVLNGTLTNSGVVCNTNYTLYNGLCYLTEKDATQAFMNATTSYISSTMTPDSRSMYVCPPCYSISGTRCYFSNTCTPICNNGYVPNYNKMCVPCPLSHRSLNNVCVYTQPGYYSNAVSEQQICPRGTWSAGGAKACVLCRPGTFRNQEGGTAATDCLDCGPGTYSANFGQATCDNCSEGVKYSTVQGATSESSCQLCRTNLCSPSECTTGSCFLSACTHSSDAYCANCKLPPTTLDYVTSLCTNTNDTVTSPYILSPGYYLPGFSQGSPKVTTGIIGPILKCSCFDPDCNTAMLEYATSVCGNFTNTQVATMPRCTSGFYYATVNRTNYNTLKATPYADCTQCFSPSALTGLTYISTICSNIARAYLTTATAPSTGYFLNGFSSGSAYVLGSAGMPTQCSLPTNAQYTSVICSNITDTTFLNFTTSCPSGTNYFTKGVSGNAYTTGADSNCATCSDYRWKSSNVQTNVSVVGGTYGSNKINGGYFTSPNDVCIENSNIYVADSNYIHVIRGNLAAAVFFGTGAATAGVTNISNATSIKYYNSNVYFLEVIVTSTSMGISRLPTTGTGTLTKSTFISLDRPISGTGVYKSFAIDTLGNFYVPYYLSSQSVAVIDKYDPTGTTKTATITNSSITTKLTNATLYKPNALAIDSQGDIIILDNYNYILRYNQTTSTLSNIYSSATSISGSYLAIDINDNILITDYVGGKVNLISTKGNPPSLLLLAGKSGTSSEPTSHGLGKDVILPAISLSGINVDATGNVYFVNKTNFIVQKIY